MDQQKHAKADNLSSQIKICDKGIEECQPKEDPHRPFTDKQYMHVSIPLSLLDTVKTVLENAKKGFESEYAAL